MHSATSVAAGAAAAAVAAAVIGASWVAPWVAPATARAQPATARAQPGDGAVQPAGPGPTRASRGGAAALGEAFRALSAQEPERAYRLASAIDRARLANDDYALYVLAQAASLTGRTREALGHFRALSRRAGSRFRAVAPWRAADCLWELGREREAQREYRRLVSAAAGQRQPAGDVGLARFRIALADARRGARQAAIRGLRSLLLAHPAHPMAADATAKLRELGGERAARMSAADRIERAQVLSRAHLWHEAVAELALIGDDEPAATRRERDYWTAMTLFRMRRRYKDAGDILLRIYDEMGGRAADALFHGARALSRADFDADAIRWYQHLVDRYPRAAKAAEAQFLSGWLEFNMGRYDAAIPHLERTIASYGRSRWAGSAQWFLGLSHYLRGDLDRALPRFGRVARQSGKLSGGKGQYWHARTLHRLGRRDAAIAEYRELVGRYPFSWYALLARARLGELSVAIGPFGDRTPRPDAAPPLDTEIDPALARAPLIRAVDELIAADLGVEAGYELQRAERGFLRQGRRPAALAVVLDRYRRAGNFNRPWMIAVVYGGARALDNEPAGRARIWWEHAYPLAYRDLVDKWRDVGRNPRYYLYAIMRKESGFNPHTLSYADAIGLLQMIPATTRRVAERLGMTYTRDLLYDPESNIKTGSWYIGRLLHKFKSQIPLAAGSFNSGPRPVMRWLGQRGALPIDEFVELVPYQQTREYMKKVTETYARYLYLYDKVIYEQPLTVDAGYIEDEVDY